MSSRFRDTGAGLHPAGRFPIGPMLTLAVLLTVALPSLAADVFRVCADPNNLPFSNDRREGFENRLAEIIARDLGARLEYTWWQERRGYVRNSLNADRCDAIFGVPQGIDNATLTRPYYRSTYVFVARRPGISSLFDERLQHLRVGAYMAGDNYIPPANALAPSTKLVGYGLFGPLGEESPPARMIEAVARGDLDVAIAWGPFAGYFGRGLSVTPVSPPSYRGMPFVYDISMAVRKGNESLKARLDTVLARECGAIHSLLKEYNVPLAPAGEEDHACAPPSSSSASSH